MGRHYGLDILPAFVYTSCCLPYELESADMLVVIIDMRDGGMGISKMGRLWDPGGLLLVPYQVSSPGRKHIPWDPGGIAHELEKSWHWLEGKPVVKEEGVSAALYPTRDMGHLSLGQQRWAARLGPSDTHELQPGNTTTYTQSRATRRASWLGSE